MEHHSVVEVRAPREEGFYLPAVAAAAAVAAAVAGCRNCLSRRRTFATSHATRPLVFRSHAQPFVAGWVGAVWTAGEWVGVWLVRSAAQQRAALPPRHARVSTPRRGQRRSLRRRSSRCHSQTARPWSPQRRLRARAAGGRVSLRRLGARAQQGAGTQTTPSQGWGPSRPRCRPLHHPRSLLLSRLRRRGQRIFPRSSAARRLAHTLLPPCLPLRRRPLSRVQQQRMSTAMFSSNSTASTARVMTDTGTAITRQIWGRRRARATMGKVRRRWRVGVSGRHQHPLPTRIPRP